MCDILSKMFEPVQFTQDMFIHKATPTFKKCIVLSDSADNIVADTRFMSIQNI